MTLTTECAKLSMALGDGLQLAYLDDLKKVRVVFSESQIPSDSWFRLPTGNLLIKRGDEITIYDQDDERIQGLLLVVKAMENQAEPITKTLSLSLMECSFENKRPSTKPQTISLSKSSDVILPESQNTLSTSPVPHEDYRKTIKKGMIPSEPFWQARASMLLSSTGDMIWDALKKEENQAAVKGAAVAVGRAALTVAKDKENRKAAVLVSKTASKLAWDAAKDEENRKMVLGATKKSASVVWNIAKDEDNQKVAMSAVRTTGTAVRSASSWVYTKASSPTNAASTQ